MLHFSLLPSCIFVMLVVESRSKAVDFTGPYCAVRQGRQCCTNRNDGCTMPIGDSMCYCDEFCYQSKDCCPDFEGHCHGWKGKPGTDSLKIKGNYDNNKNLKPIKIEDSYPELKEINPAQTNDDNYQEFKAGKEVTFIGHGNGYILTGFTGDFCKIRPVQQCCKGRDDECTMPILDTLCYCDEFCVHDPYADCCPDFAGVCQGKSDEVEEQEEGREIINNCFHGGRIHPLSAEVKANCNKCKCTEKVVSKKTTEYNWQCDTDTCLIQPEIIENVNNGKYSVISWLAKNYTFLWGESLKDGLQYRLGTKHPNAFVQRMRPIRKHHLDEIPESFDARNKWPNFINEIMDQGNCGSSWAFSTTSVASDRIAIQSKGQNKVLLAPQHLVSCNRNGQDGCRGGHLDRAWWYMRRVGSVTNHCYPFKSGLTNKAGQCMVPRSSMPSNVKCPTSAPVKGTVYRTTPPYRIKADEKDIMREIMDNGPVQATLEVKEDFYMYSKGIYQYSLPSYKSEVGKTVYHSVKIIGWGVERKHGVTTNYWLCANSWGTAWGESGYFRIVRGKNECQIESFVLGVWGKKQKRVRRHRKH